MQYVELNVTGFYKAMSKQLDRVMRQAAKHFYKASLKRIPYDTGFLRGAWKNLADALGGGESQSEVQRLFRLLQFEKKKAYERAFKKYFPRTNEQASRSKFFRKGSKIYKHPHKKTTKKSLFSEADRKIDKIRALIDRAQRAGAEGGGPLKRESRNNKLSISLRKIRVLSYAIKELSEQNKKDYSPSEYKTSKGKNVEVYKKAKKALGRLGGANSDLKTRKALENLGKVFKETGTTLGFRGPGNAKKPEGYPIGFPSPSGSRVLYYKHTKKSRGIEKIPEKGRLFSTPPHKIFTKLKADVARIEGTGTDTTAAAIATSRFETHAGTEAYLKKFDNPFIPKLSDQNSIRANLEIPLFDFAVGIKYLKVWENKGNRKGPAWHSFDHGKAAFYKYLRQNVLDQLPRIDSFLIKSVSSIGTKVALGSKAVKRKGIL